ncbi:MAG: alpha/beta fold hydrolase, partial [Deltaproteobacteria bacterium]|nr:alpha/beta fold hydrolase [Deltaproteobacteria bacterium]
MSELYSIAKGDPKNPPVLCIHGLLGSARNLYRVIETIAGAGFYVLGYDQRGHG